MDRCNLFQFATQEPAHAAFWAWVFQATDADAGALEGPKGVGQSAIRLLDGPIAPGSVEVETEPSLHTRDRPDLRVEFGDGHALFVEVKKDATFQASQLERYRSAIDNNDRVALISTHFDVTDPGLAADEAKETCPVLGLSDIRELLWPHSDEHPLLSDYAAWADERKDAWDGIERHAFADDPDAVAAALSTLYGQTRVMLAVTEDMTGRLKYTHSNRSGDPYTEFRFVEAGPDQDALFYCIDEYEPGYYISLKQYLPGEDADAWAGKEDRLERLRAWWIDAAADTDHRFAFRTPHNNGTKTREVACLLFKKNPPSVVAEDLPPIHEAFTARLRENGWQLDDENV